MQIKDMLEKFNSLNEKAEELKALMKILKGQIMVIKKAITLSLQNIMGFMPTELKFLKSTINVSLMLLVKLLMRQKKS